MPDTDLVQNALVWSPVHDFHQCQLFWIEDTDPEIPLREDPQDFINTLEYDPKIDWKKELLRDYHYHLKGLLWQQTEGCATPDQLVEKGCWCDTVHYGQQRTKENKIKPEKQPEEIKDWIVDLVG